MKPVDQTKFGEVEGNCLEACLASILELPLDKVPEFRSTRNSCWLIDLNHWLEQYGLQAMDVDDFSLVPKGYCIVAGASPRLKTLHGVVYLNGKMVHDPHPSRDGIKSEPVYWTFFACLRPHKHKELPVDR